MSNKKRVSRGLLPKKELTEGQKIYAKFATYPTLHEEVLDRAEVKYYNPCPSNCHIYENFINGNITDWVQSISQSRRSKAGASLEGILRRHLSDKLKPIAIVHPSTMEIHPDTRIDIYIKSKKRNRAVYISVTATYNKDIKGSEFPAEEIRAYRHAESRGMKAHFVAIIGKTRVKEPADVIKDKIEKSLTSEGVVITLEEDKSDDFGHWVDELVDFLK